MSTSSKTTSFKEEHLQINGIDTAVFTAGQGPPLVFFHGAGTVTGFDKLLPLATDFRLVVAHHPGFGSSGDDTSINLGHATPDAPLDAVVERLREALLADATA